MVWERFVQSRKDERNLYSKQLTLNPSIFESQTQELAGVLGRKWSKIPVYVGVLFRNNGVDPSKADIILRKNDGSIDVLLMNGTAITSRAAILSPGPFTVVPALP
jgi:hypothetical protein